MPSSYTPNLGLEKPATGEQAGVWGTTVNNTFDFLDAAIDGVTTIQLSASGYTLQINQGATSIARNKVIRFTGTLAADSTITIAPNTVQKVYYVTNLTDGGFSLLFAQGSGGTFKLLTGHSAVIYADGRGGPAKVTGALDDLQVNSLLVMSNVTVAGQISWLGASIDFNKPANFTSTVTVTGLATFNGGASFAGAVTVAGLATFNGGANFAGAVTSAGMVYANGGATITSLLYVNFGSDATGDILYRHVNTHLWRLPIGAAGQVLTVAGGEPRWVALPVPPTPPGMSVGAPVAGATNGLVLYTNASNNLAQDTDLKWTPGTGLSIGMPPLASGMVIGRGIPATITMDSNAAPLAQRAMVFSTNMVPRWKVGVDSAAESGGAVGSNFAILGYNDAGTGFNSNFWAFRNGHCVFGIAGDNYPAQVQIQNSVAAQEGLTVVGWTGQSAKLQSWKQASGTTVASIDNAGNLILAGTVTSAGGGGLALNAQGRLEIGFPVATGHPLGTLHVGVDTSGVSNCSIAMEKAGQRGNLLPVDVGRIFFYRTASNFSFVIEYNAGGNQWYASLPLVAGGAPNWQFNTVPV